MKCLIIRIFFLFFITNLAHSAQEGLCMDGVCIGDDVESVNVEWKKIVVKYKEERIYKALRSTEKSIDDLYYEYNETLIADQQTLEELAPNVIQFQKFDETVLNILKKVKAICTPLSLTGEIINQSKDKTFVTFRAVADGGNRGLLRVVRLEKEYAIFPSYQRPSDGKKYLELKKSLKIKHPKLVTVRDIDARAGMDEVAYADAILGFRFFSDVNNPLIFRLIDLEDIEYIEDSKDKSKLCPEE